MKIKTYSVKKTSLLMQARRQEFPEGGSSTRVALAAGGSGVFGTKSLNLAISKHFIQTFGKSCFSKLII